MQNNSLNHPTHPVRNFFYVLWSFLNILAFAGLFFALATPTLPFRAVIILASATLLVFALLFGFFRPLLTAGRR